MTDPRPENDPRVQPYAYITNGHRLFEVVRQLTVYDHDENNNRIVGSRRTLVQLNNVATEHPLILPIGDLLADPNVELVRAAPAAAPDYPQLEEATPDGPGA